MLGQLLDIMEDELINFDILFGEKVKDETARNIPSIDQHKPPFEIVEKCRRFLVEKGITCHSHDFGLSCSAPKLVIEKVFQTKLIKNSESSYLDYWRFSNSPKIPDEILQDISQITFPPPPELF